MLAAVLNVPRSEEDWAIWSYANYDALNQIRAAILTQRGVRLPEYVVEPIPFQSIDVWLSNIQQANNDYSSALGQQGNNLTGVDFNNENEKESWINLNFMSLRAACSTLGLGP